MKHLVFFILLASTCSSKYIKNYLECPRVWNEVTFNKTSDTSAVLLLQKLGTHYLKFEIDSCRTTTGTQSKIYGRVYKLNLLAQNQQKCIPNAKIELAEKINKQFAFRNIKYCSKSNDIGLATFELNLENPNLYILVSANGQNSIAFQLLNK